MKRVMSLDGKWQVAGFDEGRGNWARPDALTSADAMQLEGHVPGEIHTDLLDAGLIRDPFYAMNAEEVQWIEEKEWWYKQTFDIDEDFLQARTFLEFDGLDTYATIYINGRELGRTANVFIPQRFNVGDMLQVGRNTVAIRFDTSRVNSRKMQCSFDWDWTHRFVGAGLWRGVRLVSYESVAIKDVYIEPEIEGSFANAWINIEVENFTGEDQPVMASIVVGIGENREKIEVTDVISPFGGIIEAVIRIEEPQLWWPNGFGEQPLYNCMVGLETEDGIQDVAERKFGIRKIRLLEHDEQGNDAFTFEINGERVFCKGSNWVPADHFPSRITEDRYRELVELAVDANFNMLRVWGGGIYEHPAFYQVCDEKGIMLWQDFMFSCATYPDNDEFCREVANEAEIIVRRLRNHPSIVMWSGNNEREMGYTQDEDWPGKKLFHEIIPRVLQRIDDTRPYRPCSPYGGQSGNDPARGDFHGGSWFDVYQGDCSEWRRMIEKENGLFISEFGTQGPPELDSLRRFIPEDKLLPPDNDVWEFHNKDNLHSGRTDGLSHQQILIDLTRRMMGEFKTPEEFAAYAGILQGEFFRAEMEHYRREKWAISGGLSWMYNDCWPAIGWSLVDYYLRPKAAYYYAKRACAPVMLSFKELKDRVQLYVTSDERLSDVRGTLNIGIYKFDGTAEDAAEIPISLTANSSGSFWESPVIEEILADPARQCLVALLNVRGFTVGKAAYFAKTFAEMQFPQPKLLVQREQISDSQHKMIIGADNYARSVAIGNLPAAARPSDNYFDLFPGEAHEIIINDLTAEQAEKLTISVWRR